MQVLSYVLSISGLLCMMIASLIKGKNMKVILLLVFSCNALLATSYLVDGSGLNGAASCYLGALQSIINYFFDKKNKPLPIWLVVIYAVAFIVVNLLVGNFTLLGILAILASLTFVMCIGQKNGARYRVWTLINETLWTLYDILSKSYGALATHLPLVFVNIVGIIIHDIKRTKSNS